MKNTFGNSITVTLFGESHGPEIGTVLDGLPSGLAVDEAFIAERLRLRRPTGAISTGRQEADPFQIVSGVFGGRTTGTPLTILIPNSDVRSKDYSFGPARPGHADYTAHVRYGGYEDYRGGGHFSGRITAALTAAGAILLDALAQKGIQIGTHVARCAGIDDASFSENPEADIRKLNVSDFAVLDEQKGAEMREAITRVAAEGDSVGGILETMVTGMPAGIGEPWFDTLEGELAHALFSVPAVKGVEFGDGFRMADMKGSEANDPLILRNGQVATETNHNGGINGGISNGMPLVFRCAVKPTPSIRKEQRTVDMTTQQETTISVAGRHDPAIVHRARAVVDSVAAIVIADNLSLRFGTDYLQTLPE